MSEIGFSKSNIILKTIWDVIVSCCGLLITAGGGLKIFSKADSLPTDIKNVFNNTNSTTLEKFKGVIKAIF